MGDSILHIGQEKNSRLSSRFAQRRVDGSYAKRDGRVSGAVADAESKRERRPDTCLWAIGPREAAIPRASA